MKLDGAEMEGLELLAQYCEWKMSSIKLDSKWQDIEKAKEFLESHGYVEQHDHKEEEEDEEEEGEKHSSIWFERAHPEKDTEEEDPEGLEYDPDGGFAEEEDPEQILSAAVDELQFQAEKVEMLQFEAEEEKRLSAAVEELQFEVEKEKRLTAAVEKEKILSACADQELQKLEKIVEKRRFQEERYARSPLRRSARLRNSATQGSVVELQGFRSARSSAAAHLLAAFASILLGIWKIFQRIWAKEIEAVDNRAQPVWRPCSAIQVTPRREEDLRKITVEIPIIKSVKVQYVGLTLVVEPIVWENEAHFHVKFCIKKLAVGVRKEDVLQEKECIGYYTEFVSLKITPKLDGREEPVVATFENFPKEEIVAVKTNKTTAVGAQLGKDFCQLKFDHNRGIEQVEEKPKQKNVELAQVNDPGNGSSAIFEWRILRWNDGKEYKPKNFRRNLPIKDGIANVGPFPDILWRFPPFMKNEELQFQIHLEVKLRLIWKDKWVFTSASKTEQERVQFKYELPLRIPEY